MGRLIDADKFEAFVIRTNGDEEFVNGVQYVLERIDNAPTVEAIPKVDVVAMLDKLRAELEKEADASNRLLGISEIGLRKALKIIDKYMTETEVENGSTN